MSSIVGLVNEVPELGTRPNCSVPLAFA